jgi:hypothetical protein
LLEQLSKSDLPRSRAGVRRLMRDRWAAQIAARDEMIGIAREIPGAEAWPFRATLFGPLRVLPGTRRAGVLTDEEVLRLASGIDLAERLVEQGGVVIMRPLVIHASSKATSEPRRVLPRRVLHRIRFEKIAEGLELTVAWRQKADPSLRSE